MFDPFSSHSDFFNFHFCLIIRIQQRFHMYSFTKLPKVIHFCPNDVPSTLLAVYAKLVSWCSFCTPCHFRCLLLIPVWLLLCLHHMICVLDLLDAKQMVSRDSFFCLHWLFPLEIKVKSRGITLTLCVKEENNLDGQAIYDTDSVGKVTCSF